MQLATSLVFTALFLLHTVIVQGMFFHFNIIDYSQLRGMLRIHPIAGCGTLTRRITPSIGSDHDSIGVSINRRNPMGIQVVDIYSDP
jgi:hypothetical protein